MPGSEDCADALFGPTAMLLIGFSEAETAAVAFWLDSALGAAEHVDLVTATAATLAGTLADALQGDSGALDPSQPHPPPPRTVILSGMYSAEVVEVIAAWRADLAETGTVPEPVWAAAVPNNWGRIVSDLVEAIAADDAAMRAAKAGGGEQREVF